MRAFLTCHNEGRWDFPATDLLILNGDFVNVFPKPPKPLEGSIAYEVAGEEVREALKDFGAYRQEKSEGQTFRRFVDELFRGRYAEKTKELYRQKLREGFHQLKSLAILVYGNLDFPDIVVEESDNFDITCLNGVTHGIFGGVGGIPASANPVGGKFPVFPGEREDEDYVKELDRVGNECEVLITHLNRNDYERIAIEHSYKIILSAEIPAESNEKTVVPPDYFLTGQGVWIDG